MRQELKGSGYKFKTSSNAEIITGAYQLWGVNYLAKLNGNFSIVIWDNKKRTLLLARDRMGIREIYYHQDGYSVTFGSQIKCIIRNQNVERELYSEAIHEYLTFRYVAEEKTLLKGIYKVLPAHTV